MSNELVEARPFLLMDQEDEKQIIAEMQGEIIKQYVYSYHDRGRVVEGLSLAGINAVSIHMAETGHPMRVIEQNITEDAEFIKAVIKVGRYSVKNDGTEVGLDSAYGAKRQAKFYVSGKENPFAFEQAISKAERNARKKLIPEKVIVELMKQYKNEGKVKEIKATDADYEVQNNPGTKSDQITPEQIDELKKLARDIGYKKLDLAAYRQDPGAYHRDMEVFSKMKGLIAETKALREERVVEEGFLKDYAISSWDSLHRIAPQRLEEMIDELRRLPLANEPEKVEPKKLTKAEKIQAIKDKIKELGYKENSPEVTSMLTPYGVFNVSQLVSLDGATLGKILREEFGEEKL